MSDNNKHKILLRLDDDDHEKLEELKDVLFEKTSNKAIIKLIHNYSRSFRDYLKISLNDNENSGTRKFLIT